MKSFHILIILSVCTIFTIGCKKFVEVDPPETFVTSGAAFSSNQTAIAELNGIYADISAGTIGATEMLLHFQGISTVAGMSADEFDTWTGINANPQKLAIYYNMVSSANMPSGYWDNLYRYIFQANTVLEGLNRAKTSDEDSQSKLSPAVKRQLLGEAKFIRAFAYFYLVNLFGDVPLITTTDYKVNSVMPRTNKDLVYKQMVTDLLEAKELMNDRYVNQDAVTVSASSERTRPIKWTAGALLARVYLYMGKYSEAGIESTSIIENTSLYSLVAPNLAFLKNSRETIFSLQPVVAGYHSVYGRYYILPSTGPTEDCCPNNVYLNNVLVESFESGDPRLINWIGSVNVAGKTYYYPAKYKKDGTFDSSITPAFKSDIQEYNMVLRLSEQLLIRAEVRARANDISGAVADLNEIRKRARNGSSTALPDLSATLTQVQLLDAISTERRHELFTEWGDRWFDLRRIGKLDLVMTTATPKKGPQSWNPDQAWYPIPLSVIEKNPNLAQNKGY